MLKREATVFLIVGVTTVIVDFVAYKLLMQLIGVDIAKAVGFITGTVFAYFANRYWTFNHQVIRKNAVFRFALLYSMTLLINIIANRLVLNFFDIDQQYVVVAFVCATGLSAVLNFSGMKWYVFASKRSLIK